MSTRQEYGRSPIATSRSPISKPRTDAAALDWREAHAADQVRVVDSAAPGPAEEFELCLSRDGGEVLARIRHRVYIGHELASFKETEPGPESKVRARWADLLAGRAR